MLVGTEGEPSDRGQGRLDDGNNVVKEAATGDASVTSLQEVDDGEVESTTVTQPVSATMPQPVMFGPHLTNVGISQVPPLA